MKEFIGTTANNLLSEVGGKFTGVAEVIVIYTEPQYRSSGINIERVRLPGQFRVRMGKYALRQFAKHILEYADDLEKLEGIANRSWGEGA